MKMKKQNNWFIPKLKYTQLSRGISFAAGFVGTTLIASSVVQASDLQIYATPTAGKKTIVMMLDTSGSMDGTDSGQTGKRITRLQNGMYNFLDSPNPIFKDVSVGLGRFFYSSGDGGRMLVEAQPLGEVGSAQRVALRNAVKNLSATDWTPSSHAYAEAAAYLMGTSTLSKVTLDAGTNIVPVYFQRSGSNGAWYYCDGLNNLKNDCASWSSLSAAPSSADRGNNTISCNVYVPTLRSGTCYRKTGKIIITQPNLDSGFSLADNSTIDSSDTSRYKSPLPEVDKRVSCDGQGIYFLSDGAANRTSSARSTALMSAALEGYGATFNCSGGLTGGGSDSGWDCMGEFAKKLYNKDTNPSGVSIQTAFVGFGNEMNSLANVYVQNACKLSSRTQADRTGDDACSPGSGYYSVTSPGYGNGGFFTTQSAQGVTDSVVAFINNLGKAPLEPLTTGAISVPVDNLNPSGLQPYGYLRGLEPNPQASDLIWVGNLKKYQVIQTGSNAGAFAAAGSKLVYDSQGGFNSGTRDLWNNSTVYNGKVYNDGGVIRLGGAYSKVPMPILGQTENLAADPPQYAYAANPNALRNLFTDVKATGGANLTNTGNNTSLIKVPEGNLPTSGISAYVLGQFKNQATLKDFPLLTKIKLLNYLGFSVPYDETATALPTTLQTSNAPFLAMGGSIHSLPVQLTYSGTLDEKGNLTSTRSQSVLYGTMDGGLHIVDSSTGAEQMVFVPAELLRSSLGSKALIKGQTDTDAPVSGTDGAWISDSTYKTQRGTGSDSSTVKALSMNIYGGMRMGGSSYYALDVLNPSSPKLKFRLGADVSGFERIGQSWSKPVLANVRFNGVNKRVMIVGGGYDQCYENPQFELGKIVSNTDFPDTTCNNKVQAQGNAVYMVDADNGSLIWSATYGASTADADKKYLKHSIVSRISAIDRDGDGLVDNLYFADLGGQVFRADLDNYQTKSGSSYSSFGVRVSRIANLASNDTINSKSWDYTGSKAPRFYEAPTLTIHDEGANTFLLVGLASGNRSTPLDVVPTVGREKLLPTTALSGRPVNNVYGLIDRDFIEPNLMKSTYVVKTSSLTLDLLQKNPQLLTGKIANVFFGTGNLKQGWYRSLSSMSNGTERGGTAFRVAGGMKAYEEAFAITGNLIIPVYDPQGTGISGQDPCKPRVVGETDRQVFCLPYGACLKTDGTIDNGTESKTGFQTKTKDCPPGIAECNDNVIGTGIRGLAMAPITSSTANSACPDKTLAGNEKGTGKWSCQQIINPTRWYDKWLK
ncbi:pilus assembly protein PilY [Acinetobacter guillouiae]|uniref:pilus assembly protein PilY n=1 Tax=Acinetobacter guillouiae TaxID=106649 RepID=UPI003CC95424